MKKLTLLVASFAMGVASVFAFTPSGTPLTGTEGTADTRTGWQTEFTFGDALAAQWGQYRVDVAGWDTTYNVVAITVADASDFRYSIHNNAEDLGVVTGEFWLDQTNAKAAKLVDSASVVTEAGKTTYYINFASAGVDACVGLNFMTNNGGTIYSVAWYKGDVDPTVEPAWKSKDGTVKLYGELKVGGYKFQHEDFGSMEIGEITYYDSDNYAKDSYWYDTFKKDWVKTGYPAINQNFTFALQATAKEVEEFMDYQTETPDEVQPTIAIHSWVAGGTDDEQSGDCRLERVAADKYIYAAEMNFSELKGEQGGLMSNHFESKPITNNAGETISTNEFWFNVTIAFFGDETAVGEAAAWWACTTNTNCIWMAPALAQGETLPAADQDWIGKTGCSFLGGIKSFGNGSGIEDVIANSIESGKTIKTIVDGNVVIVKGDAVYSILGEKIK